MILFICFSFFSRIFSSSCSLSALFSTQSWNWIDSWLNWIRQFIHVYASYKLYIMTWLQSTSTENFSILMHGMQSIERLCIPNVCFVPHAPRFEVRLHSEAICACHPPTCSEDVPFCAEQRNFSFCLKYSFLSTLFLPSFLLLDPSLCNQIWFRKRKHSNINANVFAPFAATAAAVTYHTHTNKRTKKIIIIFSPTFVQCLR